MELREPLKTAKMQPNQSLQLTLDTAGRSATAEHPSVSSATEHRRYRATSNVSGDFSYGHPLRILAIEY